MNIMDALRSTCNLVFTMVRNISMIFLFVSIIIEESLRGENTFENEETYLMTNVSISKRSVLTRDNPFGVRMRFNSNLCVRGYKYNLTERRCKAFCLPGRCKNGDCIKPNVCKCFSGWTGRNCDTECSYLLLDENCRAICNCKNGGICISSTLGICLCSEGWSGIDCSEPCPEGYYGSYCRQSCSCKNNATCDPSNGRCNCSAGYQGPICEEKCPVGSHGYKCTDKCKCQNGAICHHVDGSCECSAGWTGPICTEMCPEGRFGINCSGTCNCYNNTACNFVTGECICNEGFYGDNCEIECLSEEWGMSRSQECICEDEECSSLVGNCSCLPGFNGSYCQKRDCPANKWGPDCLNECNCGNYSSCHPVTGLCCCQASWTGEKCSVDINAVSLKLIVKQTKLHTAAIVAAIFVPVATLLIIAAGVLCYVKHRRKVNENGEQPGSSRFTQLKSEE